MSGNAAPGQVNDQARQAPEKDASGHIAGPNGYRTRVGVVPETSNYVGKGDGGAISYEVRKGADNNPLSMVVAKDGTLIQREKAISSNNESNGKAWIPPTQEASDAVVALLEQRAQTELGSPARKEIDAKLREIVTGQARQAGVPAAVPTSAAGEVVEAPVGRRTGELARDSGEGLEVRGAPAAVTAELTNNGPNSGTSVPNVGTVEPDSLDVPPAPRDFKQAVLTLRNEIGWADRGGRLIRTPEGSGYDGGDAVGRTAWVPKSPFWGGRPGVAERSAVTEAEAARAFDKYENGKHLSPKELRFIQYAESYERDYNEQGQEIDALSKEQSAQESRDEILSLRDAEIAEARANRGNRGNTERARLESAIDADLSTLTDAEVRQLASDLQQGITSSYVGGRPIAGVENLVGYERRKRQGKAKAHVAFIDGDDFKSINDTHGHEVGDQVIHAIAGALVEQAPGAVIHRSGDEFFVESDDRTALETAMKAAQDTLAAKTFTFIGPNGETASFSNIGFSYGIAQDTNSAEAALLADKDRRKAAGLRTGRRSTDVAPEGDRRAPVQAGQDRGQVGTTIEAAEKAVASRFGTRMTRRLKAAGVLRIVDSAEAKRIHPQLPDDATGFQKGGVGYVIADRASVDEIPGLVLHEVAGHYGLPAMLGDQWPVLLKRMESLKGPDKDVTAAFNGVQIGRAHV